MEQAVEPVESAEPEGLEPVTAPSQTRAARRRAIAPNRTPSAQDLSVTLVLVRVGLVAALAGLIVLTAWAHPWALAAAYVWACVGVGWGWGEILGIPGRRVLTVTTTAGVLAAGSALIGDGAGRLGLVPVALAASIILAFLLQLLRRDGRSGLTEEIVATSGALAFVGLGAGLVPLTDRGLGAAALTVAMVGVGVSLVADAISMRLGPSVWALVVTFGLGGLLGGIVGGALGLVVWWHGVTVGAVSAVLSYVVRRLAEATPGSDSLAGQVATACASVLAVGVLAEVLARTVIGI